MKRLAALASFLLLSVTARSEENPVAAGDGLPDFLRRYDTNNDGFIDEEERQAIRDLRNRLLAEKRSSLDQNKDGIVSAKEIALAREELRMKIEERREAKFLALAGEDRLLSPQEFALAPGMARMPRGLFEALWRRLDLDASGQVSLEEFCHRLRSHR